MLLLGDNRGISRTNWGKTLKRYEEHENRSFF